jgi:hypothetical protein
MASRLEVSEKGLLALLLLCGACPCCGYVDRPQTQYQAALSSGELTCIVIPSKHCCDAGVALQLTGPNIKLMRWLELFCTNH